MFIILLGVFLTILQYLGAIRISNQIYLSILAIVVAAICYPLGNRKVMMTAPKVTGLERMWGMLLCTYPTWIFLAFVSFYISGAPSAKTMVSTLLVALFSGIIATAIFFHATYLVFREIKSLSKVEATQAMELVFSILLSAIFLHHPFSLSWELVGVLVIIVGILGISLRK